MAISDRDIDSAIADIPVTRDAREALDRAADASSARGLSTVDPVEVLRAVLGTPGGLAAEAVRALDADPVALAASLTPDGAPQLPLRQLLVNANREAQVLGHYRVDPVHLLLALMYSDTRSTSAPLQQAGLTLYDLRRHLQTGARRNDPVAAAPSRSGRPDRSLRRRPLPRLRGVLGLSPIFLALLGLVIAAGVLLWTGVLPDAVGILTVAFVFGGWITTVCVHEFSHALVGYLGGDASIPRSGYLTLNPLRYTNIVMSIVFPAVFLLLGGIPLPGAAVYIDRGALRSRWWDSAVSLAGPVGTLLCGLVVAAAFVVPAQLGVINGTNAPCFEALAYLGFLEMYAFVLNLIPVPPLDGFGILRPWLPDSVQAMAARAGMFGLLIVFGAIWYVPALNHLFVNAAGTLTGITGIDPYAAYLGEQHMRLQS